MLYQLSYFRILIECGHRWIRTTEGESQQIYSLPHLATLEYALHMICGAVPRVMTACIGRYRITYPKSLPLAVLQT